MTQKSITIIICTYNRSDILVECLQSLVEQSNTPSQFEVLIVDNNSTDSTPQIAEQFGVQYSNFRLVKEKKQGLSYARNRGYREATTPWVSYVDDDAKAHSNYVERALWTIRHFDFDCFGGTYYAWHKYGKPQWLPEGFGSKALIRDTVGVMDEGFASGGVIVFKKAVLEAMEGFPTHLGMKGKKISYGEETLLQVRMREKGYKLGFDPELKIDHLVAKHKLNLWWHVRSNFIHGASSREALGSTIQVTPYSTYARKAYQAFKKNLKIHTPKLRDSSYSWQHWVLDVIVPLSFALGKSWGAYKVNGKIMRKL